MAVAKGVEGPTTPPRPRLTPKGAGEGVASAPCAPRPTLVCQRAVPISPCDLGLTRTPAERGLAGLRPLTPDGGSPQARLPPQCCTCIAMIVAAGIPACWVGGRRPPIRGTLHNVGHPSRHASPTFYCDGASDAPVIAGGGSDRNRPQTRDSMAPHRACRARHCAGSTVRQRGTPRTMPMPGTLGERDQFRLSSPRSRPPASNQRGRSPPNHPRATALIARRWDAVGPPAASQKAGIARIDWAPPLTA